MALLQPEVLLLCQKEDLPVVPGVIRVQEAAQDQVIVDLHRAEAVHRAEVVHPEKVPPEAARVVEEDNIISLKPVYCI